VPATVAAYGVPAAEISGSDHLQRKTPTYLGERFSFIAYYFV